MDMRIALAGNPNSGKTTLFNALTGSNQFVGNWPGVTVEKKEGKMREHPEITIVDLPGVYSLSPYTLEEVVARNYLISERPDVILNIVDASNPERNLYLTTQLIELGIPVVIALNMMDILEKKGEKIDVQGLSKGLGCPVVELSALKGTGVSEVFNAVLEAANKRVLEPKHIFSGAVEHALAHIEEAVIHDMAKDRQRWYAIKMFERDIRVLEDLNLSENVAKHIENDIVMAELELDDDAESIIINERYEYIAKVLSKCYTKRSAHELTVSDKIDNIVTNRFLALPIFAAIMFLMYYISVTTVGTWATDWANDGLFGEGFTFFGKFIPGIPVLAEGLLSLAGTPEWLNSLLIDGIIGGVGAVLGFVPQLLVLFIFLAFLEGCGYMSRVAFVMDKVFSKFGLSGKSFIPILIGTGCGVPGIMASRTIENEADRRMTIITTTFIPCGAKLPIIALVATSLFNGAWWVAPSAYFIGMAAIICSGVILKKTKLFASEPAPFVMELPAYHMPTLTNMYRSVWERSSSFVKKAGTIILLSSIIIWLASHFGFAESGFVFSVDLPLEVSVLGRIGEALSVIFLPLGFGNAKAAVATLMGLVAKEEVVAVFGVLDFEGMTKLSAYSFLIFNLLCAPCFAAMGAIKREMNSGKWTAFAIGYQCVFAYATSFVIYQVGMSVTGHMNVIGVIAAAIVIVSFMYMLFRPNPNYSKK